MIAKKVHRLDFVEGSIYILTSVQRAIFFRKICPHFTWGPYPKENRVYYSIFFLHNLGCHCAIGNVFNIF